MLKRIKQFLYRLFHYSEFKKWCKELDELAAERIFYDQSYSQGVIGIEDCWDYYEDGDTPKDMIDEELLRWND